MSQLISSSQCRAARALLNWSQPDLALRCDMHVQTISSFENETSTPTRRTLEKITRTFDIAGIELLSQDGVRKKSQNIQTYYGLEDYELFTWDVASTVEKTGGQICVSNVKEEWFQGALTLEVNTAYRAKMAEIQKKNNFYFRILVQEGDTNFIASKYAEYRWIQKKYFKTVPFYVYGDKLAIIHFQKGPLVHVVENKDIADAQRVQFDILWDHAIDPPKE